MTIGNIVVPVMVLLFLNFTISMESKSHNVRALASLFALITITPLLIYLSVEDGVIEHHKIRIEEIQIYRKERIEIIEGLL